MNYYSDGSLSAALVQFNFRSIFCCPTDWSREDGGAEANGGGESPDGGEGEREGGGAAHAAQLDARGVPEGRREAKQRQLVGRHCEPSEDGTSASCQRFRCSTQIWTLLPNITTVTVVSVVVKGLSEEIITEEKLCVSCHYFSCRRCGLSRLMLLK